MSTLTSSKSYPKRGIAKNPCVVGKPNRKQQNRLDSRLKGYFETLARPENRTRDMSGYRKPGSMQ